MTNRGQKEGGGERGGWRGKFGWMEDRRERGTDRGRGEADGGMERLEELFAGTREQRETDAVLRRTEED